MDDVLYTAADQDYYLPRGSRETAHLSQEGPPSPIRIARRPDTAAVSDRPLTPNVKT
jgi:hypothetical protein